MPTRPDRRSARMPSACRGPLTALLVMACSTSGVMAQDAVGPEKKNWFDDPFLQLSAGMRACPVPEGPLYTEAERRVQMHSRLERGTSCWLAGKCTDSNAYRYDKALAPRIRAALAAVPGARRASVWAIVQRRWVYLQGCVPSHELAQRLARAAHAVPDVEVVVPDLMLGTRGKAPYPVAASSPPQKVERPTHDQKTKEQ